MPPVHLTALPCPQRPHGEGAVPPVHLTALPGPQRPHGEGAGHAQPELPRLGVLRSGQEQSDAAPQDLAVSAGSGPGIVTHPCSLSRVRPLGDVRWI